MTLFNFYCIKNIAGIIKWSRLYQFTLAFFLSIVIGTIFHEFGHIIVAEILGYNTTLHFGSMNYLHTNYPFHVVSNNHDLWITVGGILTTIITGTIGYIFYTKQNTFNRKKIILMFVALFWMRQIINLLIGIFRGLQTGSYFHGDEFIISTLFHLPSGFFSILTFLPGLIIFSKICYDLNRNNYLKEFLAAGILGGSLGYYLWFGILGPKILP